MNYINITLKCNLIKIRSTHLFPIFYRFFFGRSCVDLILITHEQPKENR
jgi:hypothetical protein